MRTLDYILIVVMLAAAASGCGKDVSTPTVNKIDCVSAGGDGSADKSLSSLKVCQKLSVGGEGFPFVWTDGKLYYLSSPRIGAPNEAPDSPGFIIKKSTGDTLNSGGPAHMLFVSGLVENGTLYVFGDSGVPSPIQNQQNNLSVTSTTDLIHWTTPQVVITSNVGDPFFNSSVTKTPTGFAMALEVWDHNTGYFIFETATSNSIDSGWTNINPLYDNHYAACPTIRYVDGYYYVWYLKVFDEGMPSVNYRTAVTRTQDFIHWENAPRLMFAANGVDQGSNMSDFDMVDFNGTLEMIIYDGDQLTWGDALRAIYKGTLSQLVTELYQPL